MPRATEYDPERTPQARGQQDGEVLGVAGVHADVLAAAGPALAEYRGYERGTAPHGQYLSGVLDGYQDGIRAFAARLEGR